MKLKRLDELLRPEPAQAKAKIAKHLDGELTVRPLVSGGEEEHIGHCVALAARDYATIRPDGCRR